MNNPDSFSRFLSFLFLNRYLVKNDYDFDIDRNGAIRFLNRAHRSTSPMIPKRGHGVEDIRLNQRAHEQIRYNQYLLLILIPIHFTDVLAHVDVFSNPLINQTPSPS